MKTILLVSLLFFRFVSISQSVLPSDSLSISYQMTTNLIFPYPIEKVDLGSSDLIGQNTGKRGNVLLIKAARKNFPSTNLSVYTTDGKFYSFIVKYGERPEPLNISFEKGKPLDVIEKPDAKVESEQKINAARLDSDAIQIREQPDFFHRHTRDLKMKLALRGIYIKDNLLWFKIEIRNGSQIGFNPEYVKFFVRDKHRAKRTAVQEMEKLPVWKTQEKEITGGSCSSLLFAFPGFSISKEKKLVIDIGEQGNGRTLVLAIPAKDLLKCRRPKIQK